MKLRSLFAGVALTVALAGNANATLTTIGQATYNGCDYNLIYDNDSPFGSIIWLDYTHTLASYANQMAWAGSLNDTGVLSYKLNAGINVTWSGDWRLPNTVDGLFKSGYDGTTTGGYNVTTSELGHLYYTELDNIGLISINGKYANQGEQGLNYKGPFTNLNAYNYFWSSTEYSANPNAIWAFEPHNGYQEPVSRSIFYSYQGLAVQNAMVEYAAPVPEPSTMLLFGTSIAGLAFWRRKKN